MLTGLLFLAPLAALLAVLAARRYPGERRLAALVRRRDRRPSRAPRRLASPRRRLVAPARGGRLLACALATRPPPLRA